jgi:TolA-binding protein
LLAGKGSTTPVNSTVSENTQSGAIKQLQDSYNKLNEDYQKTSQQLADSNAQIDYYKNLSKLQQAQSLAAKGQFADAANILIPLKDYKFKDSDKAAFNTLYADVTVKAAQYSYNQAFVFMQRSQFKEAADEFMKIQSYAAPGWAYMDSVLYNLGKCYLALNNTQSAVDVYKKLIGDYPKSQYAIWAGNRLIQLGMR